jgi:hypothetical protein
MPQSLSAVYIHLVFSTKHRRPFLEPTIACESARVSGRVSKEVKDYIARQPERHRKMSFQDEVRALLRKHQITWDERYCGIRHNSVGVVMSGIFTQGSLADSATLGFVS